MPEDVTMYCGATLFMGAFTLALIDWSARRAARSVNNVPLWLLMGFVVSVVSSLLVLGTGWWSGLGTHESWAVLGVMWMLFCIMYILLRFIFVCRANERLPKKRDLMNTESGGII